MIGDGGGCFADADAGADDDVWWSAIAMLSDAVESVAEYMK